MRDIFKRGTWIETSLVAFQHVTIFQFFERNKIE